MHHAYNGMPATELAGVSWRKSRRSNSSGNCVELAELPGGDVAVRNSRFPDGPALIYTRDEIRALVLGAKDGDFDYLVLRSPAHPGELSELGQHHDQNPPVN
ncbi:DUF397 domain-containing protein [Bailinhaonella thermotolerans]|uniref:DUF397 domain-containing protein n=1 Tax=Bailinhaonella thermotolerans TaxID=1070861 RepID=A0A3A4A5C8_9ACTN|nr:DUF397 domain-containing protein [Bailinhaonella thermotolerans]